MCSVSLRVTSLHIELFVIQSIINNYHLRKNSILRQRRTTSAGFLYDRSFLQHLAVVSRMRRRVGCHVGAVSVLEILMKQLRAISRPRCSLVLPCTRCRPVARLVDNQAGVQQLEPVASSSLVTYNVVPSLRNWGERHPVWDHVSRLPGVYSCTRVV